jgi:hypothetical protein
MVNDPTAVVFSDVPVESGWPDVLDYTPKVATRA